MLFFLDFVAARGLTIFFRTITLCFTTNYEGLKIIILQLEYVEFNFELFSSDRNDFQDVGVIGMLNNTLSKMS